MRRDLVGRAHGGVKNLSVTRLAFGDRRVQSHCMSAIGFQRIIAALEAASVRYVVAGGFAVNLHGFLRATQDLDILIDLDPANAALAMATLSACGMQPRVPVAIADFVDAEKRRDWFENRNMSDPLACSYEDAAMNHLRTGLAMTPAQRWQWLCETIDFCEQVARQRAEQGLTTLSASGGVLWSPEMAKMHKVGG